MEKRDPENQLAAARRGESCFKGKRRARFSLLGIIPVVNALGYAADHSTAGCFRVESIKIHAGRKNRNGRYMEIFLAEIQKAISSERGNSCLGKRLIDV